MWERRGISATYNRIKWRKGKRLATSLSLVPEIHGWNSLLQKFSNGCCAFMLTFILTTIDQTCSMHVSSSLIRRIPDWRGMLDKIIDGTVALSNVYMEDVNHQVEILVGESSIIQGKLLWGPDTSCRSSSFDVELVKSLMAGYIRRNEVIDAIYLLLFLHRLHL